MTTDDSRIGPVTFQKLDAGAIHTIPDVPMELRVKLSAAAREKLWGAIPYDDNVLADPEAPEWERVEDTLTEIMFEQWRPRYIVGAMTERSHRVSGEEFTCSGCGATRRATVAASRCAVCRTADRLPTFLHDTQANEQLTPLPIAEQRPGAWNFFEPNPAADSKVPAEAQIVINVDSPGLTTAAIVRALEQLDVDEHRRRR